METPFPVLLVAILIGTPPWAYGDTPDTSRPPTPIHIQDLPRWQPCSDPSATEGDTTFETGGVYTPEELQLIRYSRRK